MSARKLGMNSASEVDTSPLPPSVIIAVVCLIQIALQVWQAGVCQINNDGILYVTAAREFAAGHWDAARNIYPWFAYPLLLGYGMALTGVDAWPLALILDSAASTLAVLLVLRCAWVTLPKRSVLISAALLLFGNLWFNDLRATIVREHFFFLFMIGGFYCVIRDLQMPGLRYKVGFAVLTLVAALFRIEALGFLLLIPIVRAVAESSSYQMRAAFIAILITVSICAVVAYAAWGHGNIETWLAAPNARIEILRAEVLWPFESRKAPIAYIAMVCGLLLYGLINSIGLATVLAAGFAVFSCRESRRSASLYAAIVYLISGSAIYAGQIYFNLVFDQRHGLILSLAFTPIAAVGLVQLTRCARQTRGLGPRALLVSVIISLLVGFFVGLRKYDALSYRWTAGKWLEQNVTANARIASNSDQILFYGGFRNTTPELVIGLGNVKPTPDIFNYWKKYDVVVLELRRNQLDLVTALQIRCGCEPAQTMKNGRGDEILIYRTSR